MPSCLAHRDSASIVVRQLSHISHTPSAILYSIAVVGWWGKVQYSGQRRHYFCSLRCWFGRVIHCVL